MRKRIGQFLIEKGVLTPTQVIQILRHGEATGLRFGEAGIDLGLLSRETLVSVFGPSFAVDFFHLEPEYFPTVTQDLFAPEVMVRLGLLPLGFKKEQRLFRTRKILNLGMLDPSRTDAAQEALALAGARLGGGEVQGVKVFLILAEQFLAILGRVYGVTDEQLRSWEPAKVDGTLSLFLEHATDGRAL